MKYLKTFLEKQGNYSSTVNNQKILQHTNSITKEINKKVKLEGEIVDDDELENSITPINIEITGHIATPFKKITTKKDIKN